MNLARLLELMTDKEQFRSIEAYLDFGARYLEFVSTGLQAVILSQNERQYQFFQYKDDGHRNVTRPLNLNLMLTAETFAQAAASLVETLRVLNERGQPAEARRETFRQTIYTVQQSIGATLDALPAGRTNQARKINGERFERFLRLLINAVGVECSTGTIKVPVRDEDGAELFKTHYQHDLLIQKNGELKIIGSLKTSSKDRIDKIFLDKFLYSRLTETEIPHIAIFLNDVQRKGSLPKYGISTSFLSGHFKAYTVKLNPLDGVYYCDIRPQMQDDHLLKRHLRTIDHFFYTDLMRSYSERVNPLLKLKLKKTHSLKQSN